MIYIQLYLSFFKIGLFSIGGGLVALPLIEAEVVNKQGWISFVEFTDLIAISQMTPGPIAVNASTFVGNRVAGLGGAIFATLGSITPGLIIVSLLFYILNKHRNTKIVKGIMLGLKPAVTALIAVAGVKILTYAISNTNKNIFNLNLNLIAIMLFAISLFALRYYKTNPVKTMLLTGFCGGIIYLFV